MKVALSVSGLTLVGLCCRRGKQNKMRSHFGGVNSKKQRCEKWQATTVVRVAVTVIVAGTRTENGLVWVRVLCEGQCRTER